MEPPYRLITPPAFRHFRHFGQGFAIILRLRHFCALRAVI